MHVRDQSNQEYNVTLKNMDILRVPIIIQTIVCHPQAKTVAQQQQCEEYH